jgi:hypothetical protein
MPWWYIRQLLGPGLHWGRSQAELKRYIAQAERDGQPDAAEHLRIILRSRNAVMMEPDPDDEQKEPRTGAGS